MTPIRLFVLLALALFAASPCLSASSEEEAHYPRDEYGLIHDQYAEFPLPLSTYQDEPEAGLWEQLKKRAAAQHGFNLVASIIFLCAIIHTFIVGVFKELAHLHEARHKDLIEKERRRAVDKPQVDAKDDVSFRATLYHLLGEIEVVFGLWILALGGAVVWFFGLREDISFHGLNDGLTQFKLYLGKDVNYTEPLFVVIIMAIAATRPVIRVAEQCVNQVAQIFGGTPAAWWFATLTLTPLLGSFITEPAAMTIAALLLAKRFYQYGPSKNFAYATIGLLFVNISVGGTLTHFAAPPILMVAAKWDWGLGFLMVNFGWKAALGILLSNVIYFGVFRKEFGKLKLPDAERNMHMPLRWEERDDPVPPWITATHLFFLAWTVFTAHYPALFLGGFLILIGFTEATGHHQNDVKMRSPLLVGFFLAALVAHGGCQGWWIELLLTTIQNEWILMIGATVLTAFNDNAAVTYLASQAPDLVAISKYAVVAGAVTGGGLTVIANAPNPAGQAILGPYFERGVSPLKLAIAAGIPTIIMGLFLMLLPTAGMKNGPGAAPAEHAGYPARQPALSISTVPATPAPPLATNQPPRD